MKQLQLLDLKPGQSCVLLGWFCDKKYKVRWEGKTVLLEGCVNTRYILTELETGRKLTAIAESWIEDIR